MPLEMSIAETIVYCSSALFYLIVQVPVLKILPPLYLWTERGTHPGLLFAALGDLLLELDGDTALVLGIGAFGCFQICFVLSFPFVRHEDLTVFKLCAGVSVSIFALSYILGTMVIPIVAYALLSSYFLHSVLQQQTEVAVGGVLFVISDLVVLTEIILTKLGWHPWECGILLYWIALYYLSHRSSDSPKELGST